MRTLGWFILALGGISIIVGILLGAWTAWWVGLLAGVAIITISTTIYAFYVLEKVDFESEKETTEWE